VSGIPGDTTQFRAWQQNEDCFGTLLEPFLRSAGWSSLETAVATVSTGGLATAQNPGSTHIRANFGTQYVWELLEPSHSCYRTSINPIADAICDVLELRANRGRIQAQGSNPPVQKSRAWSQENPPSKGNGLFLLDEVWNSLTPSQRRDRQRAYEDARQFIQNAPSGGYPAPLSRTFQDPQRRDPTARIDIEIITGSAFTSTYPLP
jgi:hypothetical protein